MIPAQFTQYFRDLELPKPDSHKGQNGKVMIIGGSELFHAASQWALTVVSRMVDMVFYSSIPSNNELIQQAKKNFSNGIVIPRDELENYIEEANVVLIGPGMERANSKQKTVNSYQKPTQQEWDNDTEAVTNYLLSKYPHKKWVIDAGALQMVDPRLLNSNMIITPHIGEFERVMKKVDSNFSADEFLNQTTNSSEFLHLKSNILNPLPCVTLLKGKVDLVFHDQKVEPVTGGNQGMTKGGTGDVLAGLVAGLYCFTDKPFSASVVGSYVNKKAGDELYKTVGPFFNASDLANQIPETLIEVFNSLH